MTLEQKTPEVRMTTEGHVCAISLDNTAKKNAVTPELMSQLSAPRTLLMVAARNPQALLEVA